MGKLADLWKLLGNTKDAEAKEEIRNKINGIEKWCIDNKFGGFTEVTDFTKGSNKPKKVVTGPFTDHVMCGNFMIPLNQFCCKCGLDTQGSLMVNGKLLFKLF
jgi:hypothetical protein